MCGIVGILRFDGRSVRPEEIQQMNDSIRHRGPDDHGALIENGVGLGMRRLSIVDLSPWGHQPLYYEDESVAVIFNGEIYNHRDLRSRLGMNGHTFRGHSDTEVLVHGYEQLGALEMTRRLEGMFAFALYDRTRRRLFLARDGFGIKLSALYLRRNRPATLLRLRAGRALPRSTGKAPSRSTLRSLRRFSAWATSHRRSPLSRGSASCRRGPCTRSTCRPGRPASNRSIASRRPPSRTPGPTSSSSACASCSTARCAAI